MKSEEVEIEDSLEEKMKKLLEVRTELKAKREEYDRSVETLNQTRKGLENLIKAEVMERKRTVRVGNIIAKYIPQVEIRVVKEKKNGK